MVREAPPQVIHLLRALLRASTYLPDVAAREYIRGRVLQRFRSAKGVTPTRLRNARHAIGTLQRACRGERKPLMMVLDHTYGRSGPRKRQLLNRLQELESPGETLPVTDDSAKQIPGALDQFLRSQKSNQPIVSSRAPLKDISPSIPKTNIWSRPTPLKRVANLEKQFWAKTFNKILPPAPERYWYRLQRLVAGTIPFEKPPTRRARVTDGAAELCINRPIRHVTRQAKRDEHYITPRFMKRQWARVWGNCAIMVPPAEGKSLWEITWGGQRPRLLRSGPRIEKNLDMFGNDTEPTHGSKNTELRRRANKSSSNASGE